MSTVDQFINVTVILMPKKGHKTYYIIIFKKYSMEIWKKYLKSKPMSTEYWAVFTLRKQVPLIQFSRNFRPTIDQEDEIKKGTLPMVQNNMIMQCP